MKYIICFMLLIGVANAKKTSHEIAVFNCITVAPEMLGGELAHSELIIDFDLNRKKCWNELGNIIKINNTEIVCDTSVKVSNLKGFILNRFSGDLISITKDSKGNEQNTSFRCKRMARQI